MPNTATQTDPAKSEKFQRKRDRILDAASTQINRHGIKGLTFADVAQAVGLNTSSVTYYFKRKEMLASATYERCLVRWHALVEEAATQGTPRDRVRRLVHDYLDIVIRVRAGTEQQLTLLSDMRALDDDNRRQLIRHYLKLLWQVADLFGPMPDEISRARHLASAQILLDVLHWSRTWLTHYSDKDFPRVEARLLEYLEHGFALRGATWTPARVDTDQPATSGDTANSRETFLQAATLLINQRGYRGASVGRISAHLNVSKGSFYHHLTGKDGLILDCFDRSYARVSAAQYQAINTPGTNWARLTSTIQSLLSVQFDARFPLLRTTAMQALPEDLRPDIIRLSDRMAQRFAGMMIDGITETSIRSVDPLITSQCLMAGLNAAYDYQFWARGNLDTDQALQVYATPLAFGLFHDSP